MREPENNRRRIILIGLAVLAALLLLLVFRPRPVEVETARVVRGDLVLDLSTTGVVEGNVADVSPRIVGKIDQLLVDEGDRVSQGQVIARLETDELQADVDRARAALASAQTQVSRAVQSLAGETRQVNAQISRARAAVTAARARLAELQTGSRPQQIREAEAAVSQAQAQADNAQADLSRAEQLYARGAIPRAQLDEARTAARVAQANLAAARERLALIREGARSEQIEAARAEVRSAEAGLSEALAGRELLRVREEDVRNARTQVEQARAALEAAEARLDQAVIRSPTAGSVVRKHAEVGETAGPQQPVVTIAKAGPIWIAAEVDQEDVAAVAEGQQVRITLDAFPGRSAIGTVTDVSSVAVPKDVGRVRAKVVRARIELLRNPLPLRPGMEVNIDGQLKVAENALLVPNDAVLQVGDEDIVYVIRNGTADRQVIQPGLSNFDYTVVKRGLAQGQVVAVSNLDDLSDNRRVRTVEERQ